MSTGIFFEGTEETVSEQLRRALGLNLVIDGDWKTTDEALYNAGKNRAKIVIRRLQDSIGNRTLSEKATGYSIFLETYDGIPCDPMERGFVSSIQEELGWTRKLQADKLKYVSKEAA